MDINYFLVIIFYGIDAYTEMDCCTWNILRFFPSFGYQLVVEFFILHWYEPKLTIICVCSVRIVFDKNSKVFATTRSKKFAYIAIKVGVYILMLFGLVDLSFKYSWGCDKE